MSHHLSYHDVMSDIIYSCMSAGFCDAHDLDNNDPESYRRCTTTEKKVCKRNGTTDRKTPKQTCIHSQTADPSCILSQLSMSKNTYHILILI